MMADGDANPAVSGVRHNVFVVRPRSAGVDVNRARAVWVVIGAGLVLALAVTATAFTGTILFGLFVYYATRPVYDRLRRYVDSRALAAAGSLLTLAVPILLLLAYTLLLGAQEFARFTDRNDLSELRTRLGELLGVDLSDVSGLFENPGAFLSDPGSVLSDSDVQGLAGEFLGQVLGVAGFLGTVGLNLFLMTVIAYYLLKDGRRLSRWVQGKFDDDEGVMLEFVRAVDRDFQNVFFGNLLNSFLTAILAAVVYSALDTFVAPAGLEMNYPVLIGLLMAVGSLVPVVGILVIYVPVGLYLTAVAVTMGTEFLWYPLVFFAVSFVVIGALPDFVLRPYVAAGSLHVGTVLLAYTFGPLLFGWYGIFLGPVLLVLITHFGRIVLPELLDERRLAPYSIDPTNMNVPDPGGGQSVAVDGGDPAPDPTRGRGDPGTSAAESPGDDTEESIESGTDADGDPDGDVGDESETDADGDGDSGGDAGEGNGPDGR
ncbi:AI-2E family transporter [Halobacteriales archaeon SW_5_70_135]|nr:MAG: AI-2E family transporter [Halobacteriales archaeon SW_5_70_135]